MPQHKDLRLYLQNELSRRCIKNQSYSLRSFARSLELDHTALSRILRGERAISKKTVDALCKNLGINPQTIVQLSKASQVSKVSDFKDITIDTFTLISEWHHDAILEIMRLKDFSPDPKWIARKLSITVTEVHTAVERLQRLGLLEVTSTGKWKCKADHTEVGIDTKFTTAALKKYQQKILEMAIESIENVSRERRHNISSTIAVDGRDLEEIKKRLNAFRRKLSKFVQRKNVSANQVYQLGICLYPLTDKKGEPS